jgi:putative FmdB family regulatory protein
MPIYEYQCEACGHQLEALQKISDAPLLECPSCKAPQLRKKISAAGFRLKGGGWYETDFKSGGKKNVSGDKESAGGSDSSSGSSASSTAAAPSTPAPAADAS